MMAWIAEFWVFALFLSLIFIAFLKNLNKLFCLFVSIGSILGCRAEILQLDVTDVKMDCFLAEWVGCPYMEIGFAFLTAFHLLFLRFEDVFTFDIRTTFLLCSRNRSGIHVCYFLHPWPFLLFPFVFRFVTFRVAIW